MSVLVGLTGGIGSGKTTIANFFKEEGIPIYIADDAGRKVMQDPKVIQQIKAQFGIAIFEGDVLDRKALGQIVFEDKILLEKLNSIVHPAVKTDFLEWVSKHSADEVLVYESAILFENGGYKDFDFVITVTAPENVRINRVITRDHVTKDAVLARMKMQWSDDKKCSLSDFVINNTDLVSAREEVCKIIKILKIRQFEG